MIRKLVLASNNQGKIREFEEIFASINIELIPQSKFNVPEVDEPYSTYVENALHKARHCSKYTGLPTLADDSGLCVNALNGAPGVFSARYAGITRSDLNNNLKLIDELKLLTDKSAYFYCLLIVLRSFDDPQPIIADGIVRGEIIDTPRGVNGFGYNPIFYIPEIGKTMAEISSETKHQISHRAIAIQNLIPKLDHYF
jgi:XTP/dITP diphosphohydrolase